MGKIVDNLSSSPAANDQSAEMVAEIAARLVAVEEDLRLTLGAQAAHAVVAGITMLGAQDEEWLIRCSAAPESTLQESITAGGPLGQLAVSLGLEAGIRAFGSSRFLAETIRRLLDILGAVQEVHRPAIAELMVRRAADLENAIFTVPSEVAELAARVALEQSPFSTPMARDRVVFDPCLGCGEMLLAIIRRAALTSIQLSARGYETSAEALRIAQVSFSLMDVSAEGLERGDWLDQSLQVGLDFNYLVSAIEATPWHDVDHQFDHTIPISARPRSSDASLLYLVKIAELLTDLPQAIAVVAVNSAALTIGGAGSGEAQLRRYLVDTGLLHAVIMLPSGLFERTSVAPTMLILRHPVRANAENSFRLVDARNLGRQRDRKRQILSAEDLERISAAVSGSFDELSINVLSSSLGDDLRWRIPSTIRASNSATAALIGLNEDFLEDLCEIIPGRNRAAKPEGTDIDHRVITAGDISSDLAPWSKLKNSNASKSSSVSVIPGDIIGSISPPSGRWALVPDGYGPALASDHTIVLRRRADISMRYLLGYLRSDRAKSYLIEMFRGTIPRLDRVQLAKLPVPRCPLGVEYLDGVLSGYNAELMRLEQEVGRLHLRLNDIYRGESPVEIAADVDALHGVTASLRSIENLDGALRIAKASFPYPISRTLRAISRTKSPRVRYHEIVHQGLETISTVLTSIAAAVARERGISGAAIKSWAKSVQHNGATIGSQRSMFAEVARAVLTISDGTMDVGGLGQALGDTSSPAATFLSMLLAERNRIHGDYPRSEYEFERRLAKSEGVMNQFLDSLSFLARWELRYAESIEPVPGVDDRPDFSGEFAVLRGDNPDWGIAEQISNQPLYRGRVYAWVDQDLLIDIYPFLLVLDCPQCGSKEVYYPDSYDSTQAKLKSIDRGHSQDNEDPHILHDLRTAFGSLS